MREAALRSRLWPVDGVGWKRLGPSRQQCKAGVSCGPHRCGRICVRVEFLGSLLSVKKEFSSLAPRRHGSGADCCTLAQLL